MPRLFIPFAYPALPVSVPVPETEMSRALTAWEEYPAADLPLLRGRDRRMVLGLLGDPGQ